VKPEPRRKLRPKHWRNPRQRQYALADHNTPFKAWDDLDTDAYGGGVPASHGVPARVDELIKAALARRAAAGAPNTLDSLYGAPVRSLDGLIAAALDKRAAGMDPIDPIKPARTSGQPSAAPRPDPGSGWRDYDNPYMVGPASVRSWSTDWWKWLQDLRGRIESALTGNPHDPSVDRYAEARSRAQAAFGDRLSSGSQPSPDGWMVAGPRQPGGGAALYDSGGVLIADRKVLDDFGRRRLEAGIADNPRDALINRQWGRMHGIDFASIPGHPGLQAYQGPRHGFDYRDGRLEVDDAGLVANMAQYARMSSELGFNVTPENVGVTGVEQAPGGAWAPVADARRAWWQRHSREFGMTPEEFRNVGFRIGPSGSLEFPRQLRGQVDAMLAGEVDMVMRSPAVASPALAAETARRSLISRGVYIPPDQLDGAMRRIDGDNWRDERRALALYKTNGAWDETPFEGQAQKWGPGSGSLARMAGGMVGDLANEGVVPGAGLLAGRILGSGADAAAKSVLARSIGAGVGLGKGTAEVLYDATAGKDALIRRLEELFPRTFGSDYGGMDPLEVPDKLRGDPKMVENYARLNKSRAAALAVEKSKRRTEAVILADAIRGARPTDWERAYDDGGALGLLFNAFNLGGHVNDAAKWVNGWTAHDSLADVQRAGYGELIDGALRDRDPGRRLVRLFSDLAGVIPDDAARLDLSRRLAENPADAAALAAVRAAAERGVVDPHSRVGGLIRSALGRGGGRG
jgi:hypothetical protein